MARKKKNSVKAKATRAVKALTEGYDGPFKLTVNLKTTYTSDNVDTPVSFDYVLADAVDFPMKPTDDLVYDYTIVDGPSGEEFDQSKWGKWTFIEWKLDPGADKVTVSPSEIDIPAPPPVTYRLVVEPGEATASGGDTFSVPGGTFLLENTSTDEHYVEGSVEEDGIRYSFVLSTDIPEYKEDTLYISDISSESSEDVPQVMWKIVVTEDEITLVPAGDTSYTGTVGMSKIIPDPPDVIINKTVTITADWRTDVKINYNSTSATGVSPDDFSDVYSQHGQSFVDTIEVPCPFYTEGFIFRGWENIEGKPGVAFTDDAKTLLSINVSENTEVDLNATWRERPSIIGMTQEITFHSNFGDDATITQEVEAGRPTQLITNQWERTDDVGVPLYDFLGWAISEYGEVKYENNAMYDVPNDALVLDEDSDQWVMRNLDLYAVWKKKGSKIISEDDICIVGYDPFPVVFRDMSRIRSFKNSYWTYDFGDSVIYGCDTSDVTVNNVTDAKYANFRLPSDQYIFNRSTVEFKKQLKIPQVDIGVMIPDYKMDDAGNVTAGPDYSSYHYQSFSENNSHFTGVKFTAIRNMGEDFGRGCYPQITDDPLSDFLKRVWYWPNSRNDTNIEYVYVSGIHELMNEDDCGRVMCERENDLKNSVMHIYKGAGIYYSTMQVSSKTGLQSMEVADETWDNRSEAEKEVIAGCYVKVLPTCPCISGFHVYGSNGSGEHYNRTFEVIPSAYSCDDGIFNTKQASFNCVIRYKDMNGVEKTTHAISGYAPFLRASASGIIESRSLPIKGAYIDWGDWFSDYQQSDYSEYVDATNLENEAYSTGWPSWKPAGYGSNKALSASGTHTYVMPGLYSVGLAPDYNTAWIKKYMPTVDPSDYDDCLDDLMAKSASGCCILVVENPPKFNETMPINLGRVANPGQHPTKVVDMSVNVKAGSYPISRIDWDFGDGTEILSISTEGYKVNPETKDVIGGTVLVDYNTEYSSAKPVKTSNITYGTMYGHSHHNEQMKGYSRWDARNYSVDHTYVRTSFNDHPNGYVISVSAYAENTNTCVTASARILGDNGAKLPDYNIIEGDIELVDVRSDESEMANIVFQSEKESRLYVNRVVDDE